MAEAGPAMRMPKSKQTSNTGDEEDNAPVEVLKPNRSLLEDVGEPLGLM